MHVLTQNETTRLTQLESVVTKGKRAFVEVGVALKEIRDSKLYRSSHGTFANYVEDKFGFQRRYAQVLIQSSIAVGNAHNCAQIETESQAREVSKAPPEKQSEVVDRASQIAAESGKKMTAAIIAEARTEVLRDPVTPMPIEEYEYEDVYEDEAEEEAEEFEPLDDDTIGDVFRIVIAKLEPFACLILAEKLTLYASQDASK